MKKQRMKVRARNAWVKALLSGDFEQGFGRLRSGHASASAYCCLGVLNVTCNLQRGGDPGCLSPRALAKVGLDPAKQDNLVLMNDVKGYTFARIASYVKRYC